VLQLVSTAGVIGLTLLLIASSLLSPAEFISSFIASREAALQRFYDCIYTTPAAAAAAATTAVPDS
jgi:hypothetical protein